MRLNRPLACSILLLNISMLAGADADAWVPLFDGTSLKGWRAAENPETFSVSDGAIVARGPRAHLFYVGPVARHDFRNFELKLEVRATPGANSGVYFHTAFQEKGWPGSGYQVQVNNTHGHPSKTGGLYGVEDYPVALVGDDEWFTLRIHVEGRRIVTRINDRVICDYTEPTHPERSEEVKGSLVSQGTFALQGHDLESEVRFRNVRVRVLP